MLNNDYVKKIYEEREIESYKGYIVLAVDGSMLELPNANELKEYFGVQEGQKGSVGRVRGRCLIPEGIEKPLDLRKKVY